jgi:hypothetical protein
MKPSPIGISLVMAMVVCGVAGAATLVDFKRLGVVTEDGFIAITDPDVEIPEAMPPQLAYRKRVVIEPFGTRVIRIAGEPGTPIVTATGEIIGTWTNFSRQHYVTTQPWNADGSLMHIYLGREDVSPNNLILSGNGYKPLYAYFEPRRESRWHPLLRSIRVQISGDTLSWYNVRTAAVVRSWRLPYRDNSTGGKWNVSQDGRYVGIVGDNRYLYVFDMSTRRGRAGPPLDLRVGCGLATCVPPNESFDLRTASNGLRFMVHYGPESNWRVVDADPSTLAITSHVFPESLRPAECDAGISCSAGSPADGFLPVLIGHPDFAVNTDGSTWIAGTSRYWFNKVIRRVDTIGGRVGRILAVNVDRASLRSLTDPVNEAFASHVATRATLRPGWVYATYNRTPDGKYQGEILAVNLNSRDIERYAHHYSTTTGCYDCEVHPSPSPDGSRVAFASTWGDDQSSALGYVLELRPPAGQ